MVLEAIVDAKIVGSVRLEMLRRDVMQIRVSGSIGAEEIAAIREYSHGVRRELGEDAPLYNLIDVSAGVSIHRSARRPIMEFSRENMWERTAIFGAPRPVRVLLELVDNAIRLLVEDVNASRFFATREEALAWLLEREP